MNKIYICEIDSLSDDKVIVWAEGIVPNMRLKIGIDLKYFLDNNIEPQIGLEIEYNKDTKKITIHDDYDPKIEAEFNELYNKLLPKLEKFNKNNMEIKD